ncbi:MAG TPA: hypothetical protein VEC16_02670 [Alphaproteobacteria bacterium]|nr:hypothetical protein [Alphaproteobacteria bacterium]
MEREVSELDRKLILKRNYLDKIYFHLNKDPIDQDELYQLVRKFFGEYLKLDYEFTYEELSQELNKAFIKPKVKEQIDSFLIRLSESEYLEDSSLGTAEINAYLNELNEIIKNIIYEEGSILAEPTSVIKKVFGKDSPDKAAVIANINASIDEAVFFINKGNLDSAKASYTNAMKSYDTLSKSDKKALHDKINDVYERIQGLTKSPARATAESMYSTKSDSSQQLNKLISETKSYIEQGNYDLGKASYTKALKIFDAIEPHIKVGFKPKLTELYESLQNLSQNKAKKTEQKIIPAAPLATGSLSEDISTGGNVIFGAQSPQNQQPINTQIPPAIEPSKDPTLLNPENLPDMDQIPIPEKKIFDEEENRLENFSNDLNKQINSLMTSKNIDTTINKESNENIEKTGSDFTKPILVADDSPPGNLQLNLAQAKPPSDIEPQAVQTQVAPTPASNLVLMQQTPVPQTPQDNAQDPEVIKLKQLLSRTNDDVNIERLGNAKKLYKEALLLYRSFSDVQKASCYKDFYATFKKLDEALHKESLHNIIDKHLATTEAAKQNDASAEAKLMIPEKITKKNVAIMDDAPPIVPSSAREIAAKEPEAKSDDYVPESLEVLKITTLPIMTDNDPETTRVYELIEESYFNLSNKNTDLAMLKYFKALDLYKRLNLEDKRKTYSNMYELFKTISTSARR